MFIDESHAFQLGRLEECTKDRSRKENLVDYGFRLPSALDNRPLQFNEFGSMMRQTVFVSATPPITKINIPAQVVEQLVSQQD